MIDRINLAEWAPRAGFLVAALVWLYFVFMSAVVARVAAGEIVGSVFSAVIVFCGLAMGVYATSRMEILQKIW